MLTLKKIISEFGIFGLIRLPLIFLSIVFHNIKLHLYSKDKNLLKKDINYLKSLSNDEIQKKFSFFPHLEGSFNEGTLNWLKENRQWKPFYSNIIDVLTITAHKTDTKTDNIIKDILPNNISDNLYRSPKRVPLKNDFWEYYLTPWHRMIHNFSYMLWDKRYREHLYPIYQRYKIWYNEFIWFTFLGTGSNIYAVEIGKAFHCLNEFIVDQNKEALDRYVKHVLKSKYFIKHAFQKGIPMEGGIYARFTLMTWIHLDQIHKQLGLNFEIIDESFIKEYADYLETALTTDKGFETSGDSHFEIDKLNDYRVFIYLKMISNHSIFTKILEKYPPKDFYYKPFYLKK